MPKKARDIGSGDIFEIGLGSGKFAYCRVIDRTDFGPLFEIYRRHFGHPQTLEKIDIADMEREKLAFINQHSVAKRWKYVGSCKLGGSLEYLGWFCGHPDLFWEVTARRGEKKGYSPKEISYEELLNSGFVHEALYVAERIEEFCRGETDLIFKLFVKPCI